MCFGCSFWYPLSPLGYKVLGLDPSLPLWIHSLIESDLTDVRHEIIDDVREGSCGFTWVGSSDDLPGRFQSSTTHEWLRTHADVTRDAYYITKLDHVETYRDIMRNYVLQPDENDCTIFTLRKMINITYANEQLLCLTSGLAEHSVLWSGAGHFGVNIVRAGKVSVPRSVILPQYRDSPLIAKFYDFMD